jgi:hypothetical protein
MIVQVALDLLGHWVDQGRDPGRAIGDQVRVGRALEVEELADEHAAERLHGGCQRGDGMDATRAGLPRAGETR